MWKWVFAGGHVKMPSSVRVEDVGERPMSVNANASDINCYKFGHSCVCTQGACHGR